MYIAINDQTKFEWHDDKNVFNYLKHKIRFEEALSVFTDPFALQMFDEDHSSDEERWNVLGSVGEETILFVVCTDYRNTIRLISARKATAYERRKYHEKVHTYFQDQVE